MALGRQSLGIFLRGSLVFIQDGKTLLRIKILKPEVVLDAPKGRPVLQQFQDDWFKMETRFKKPHWAWQAEDFGIAKRLLDKHGRSVLRLYLEPFWWYHSEPLSKDYSHPLRLFAASIPKIQEEI